MTTIHFADFILWLTHLSQGEDVCEVGEVELLAFWREI